MPVKRTLRESLTLFNEKADLVQSRSFTKRIIEDGAGYSMQWSGNVVSVERRYPDEEAVEAIVVTCRFFLEPRDNCSFDDLAAKYADPANGVPLDLRAAFTANHDQVKKFLAKPSELEGLSNEELLYTIVYGEIAHSNLDKQAVVDGWKKGGILYEVAYGEFVKIMAIVLAKAVAIQKVNRQVLDALPA